MLEWLMRINDYFFNQLLGALSDANPYQKLIDHTLSTLIQEHNSHTLILESGSETVE